MVAIAPEQLAKAEPLLDRHAQLIRELRQVEQELDRLLPVQLQRELARRRLRSGIVRVGDVDSPIDVKWEAMQ